MSDEPGAARATYRRLRSAAGLTDLPAIEARLATLETDVAENHLLEAPLLALVERVEAALVPVLESRSRRDAGESRVVP